MSYSALGMNDCEIARRMNIPHRTIRGWSAVGLKKSWGHLDERCPICGEGSLDREAYAYLLGVYLGDGHINNSIDIQRIFCRACDAVGVRWKQMNWKTIAVSRRNDVEKMDEFIGPKK